jgi:hypothetical protein
MWTYDLSKIVNILGTFVLAWIDGIELEDEVKDKMKETLIPYEKSITDINVLSIFNSLRNKRIETIQKTIENLKQEETV